MKNKDTPVDPWLLSKANMAKSAGVSTQALDKWGVKPCCRVGKYAYFTVEEIVSNRVANALSLHQLAPTRKGVTPTKNDEEDEESLPIDFEKYRLTKAQADAQEMKNETNRQELIPVGFITFYLAGIGAEISGIIDSLPLTIVRKHPELTLLQQENIKRELAKAMGAISRASDKLPELLDEYMQETNSKG